MIRAAASLPLATVGIVSPGRARASASPHDRLAAIESAGGGRLGVAAVNTVNGAQLNHRSGERFAFCSTFKPISVSAILKRSETEPGLLQQRVAYAESDVMAYSPITKRHAGHGMTVSELCAAALQYSDNTAANLIIRTLGGPHAVTTFARSIGDAEFRLDRWETALNDAVPGDPRDTSTPAAMMQSLRRIALGDVLGAPQRAQLVAWMQGNTTGGKRIRVGMPGWTVADKTGTGDYGTTNDLGLAWPPGKAAIVLIIYFTQNDKSASPRDRVVAASARIVAETLG